jgi:hypothetical protein
MTIRKVETSYSNITNDEYEKEIRFTFEKRKKKENK